MKVGTAFERTSAALVLVDQNNTDAACMLKRELLGLPEETDVDFSKLSDRLKKMAKKNPAQVGPLIEGFIPLGDTRARSAAHRILVHQKGMDALPHLKQSLAHARPRNSKASRSAFHHLVKMGVQVAPEIQTWLNDDNWLLRKAAASLLKRWKKLTPDLQKQLAKDPHIAVRHAATWPGEVV